MDSEGQTGGQHRDRSCALLSLAECELCWCFSFEAVVAPGVCELWSSTALSADEAAWRECCSGASLQCFGTIVLASCARASMRREPHAPSSFAVHLPSLAPNMVSSCFGLNLQLHRRLGLGRSQGMGATGASRCAVGLPCSITTCPGVEDQSGVQHDCVPMIVGVCRS